LTPSHKVQAEARLNIEKQQVKTKEAYDKTKLAGTHFIKGEVVVMFKAPNQSKSAKLQAKYRSRLLRVVEVLPSDTYRAAEISLDGQTTYTTTAHVSQLKSWRVLNIDESEGEDTVEGVEQEEDQGVVADPLPIPSTQSAGSEPLNLPRRSARERRRPAYLSQFE